jgi:hypothetical protein
MKENAYKIDSKQRSSSFSSSESISEQLAKQRRIN